MKARRANLKRLNTFGNGDLSSKRESLPARLKQWRQRLGCYSLFAAFPAMAVSHVPEARAEDAKKPEPCVAGRTANFFERLTKTYSSPALLKRQSKFLLPHQMGSFNMLTALGGNDDCPGRAIPGGNYTAAAPYTDSGDTTGANDTVSRAYYINYRYYNYDAFGPDHVYSFTLTGRGPNPQIEVSTSSGTYRPLIYVLQGGVAGACPAGTGNHAFNELLLFDSYWGQGSTATLNSEAMRFLPLNEPLHLFVDSRAKDTNGSGPYTIRIQDVTIAPAASANPIDSPEFFIRQHYLDFLNREPEPAGFDGWMAKLNQCPESELGNRFYAQDCTRIDVSASFFRSREFGLKGYYVYRFYQVSFGRRPLYSEFIADMRRVTGATDAEFEANRAAFPGEWVTRQPFRDRYDALSNAGYVDELLRTAGVTLPNRDQLVSALDGGQKTRAQVLREIVESAEVEQKFYNEAFVAMQYFGYLRRDPDGAGFDGWLTHLNRTSNYREMVWGFLYSPEYKLRFGPVPGF